MDSNEITRLLLNLVRKGTIIAVDHDRELCRVQSGDLETNWILWNTPRAGTTIDWDPPTINEQVILLCPGGDPADAVVLMSLYSDAAKAPSHSPDTRTRKYPDGAVVDYNHKDHVLTVTLPEGGAIVVNTPASITVNTTSATINADSDATINTSSATVNADEVTLNAPQTTCTGALLVKGPFTYMAGMTGFGSGKGATAKIEGTVEVTEDVVASNISLVGHVHQEQGDGNTTSKPL